MTPDDDAIELRQWCIGWSASGAATGMYVDQEQKRVTRGSNRDPAEEVQRRLRMFLRDLAGGLPCLQIDVSRNNFVEGAVAKAGLLSATR